MKRLRFGLAALLSVAAVCTAASAPAEVLPSDIVVVEDADGSIQKKDAILGDAYLQAVSCAMAKQVPAIFDAIFVFRPSDTLFTSTPSGITARQTTQGLGIQYKPPNGQAWCSARLAHAVKMNGLDKFPVDPDAEYTQGGTGFSVVEVMGHELGHQWMVGVSYRLEDEPEDIAHCRIRMRMGGEGTSGTCDGYSQSDFGLHWSEAFDSGGVMFGNQIVDLGNGQFRFHNPGGHKFGPLDQYLMGLRHPEQVGPLLLVDQAFAIPQGSYPLKKGEVKDVEGVAVNLGIDDIVRAMGPRVPASDPCHWKGAIVYVHPKGKAPTQAQLKQLAAYGTRFETWYPWATDQRGSIDLTRDGRGHGTAECPAPGNPPPTDAGGGEDVAPLPDDASGELADVPVDDVPGPADDDGETATDQATTDRGAGDSAGEAAGDGTGPATDPGTGGEGDGASGGGCAAGAGRGAGPSGLCGVLCLLAILGALGRRMTGFPKEVP